MSYCFTKKVRSDFDSSIEMVVEKLKEKGFGVLTEIDIQAALKSKLNVSFYKYKILGACNPSFAYQALQLEDKIGVMLPCNVIIQQKSESDLVEVSAVDPMASMMAIKNEGLGEVALEVQELLKQVINNLE